ncbi:MAG: IS5 family transposase [Nitrososphaerota archaeon]
MEFREISDEEWELIRPLLPPRAKTGRPRIDDRLVLNGILYVLVTGCRWMDMPSRYGHYSTAFRRFKRWMELGVWKQILNALISKGYSTGKLSLDRIAVDSTTIKARKGGRL